MLMDWDFSELFQTQPIMGVTINTVFLSPSFRQFVYILIALVLAVSAFVLLAQKNRFSDALKKALIISFFVSGVAYAVQADIGWATWLSADLRSFGGLKTDEKLLRLEGPYYDFVRSARSIIKDDYMLFSSDGYMSLRAEYFLLPMRKRDQARYIIVLGDREARFDQAKGIFIRGDVKISSVEPVLIYARDAYILKRKPS